MKRLINYLEGLVLFAALIILTLFWREEWKRWVQARRKLPMKLR